MKPIRTPKTIGVYGPPKGAEITIGSLPYHRGHYDFEINSVWELTEDERSAIFNGANILLIQIGEPIQPVGLEITDLTRID